MVVIDYGDTSCTKVYGNTSTCTYTSTGYDDHPKCEGNEYDYEKAEREEEISGWYNPKKVPMPDNRVKRRVHLKARNQIANRYQLRR